MAAAPAGPQPGGDRRADERLPALGAMAGEIMVFQPMTLRDFTQHGIQVLTTFPLQVNSIHDIRLTLGARTVVTAARVAHCSVGDMAQGLVWYKSGLEFVDMPDRIASQIRAYVDGVRQARTTPAGMADEPA